MSTRGRVGLQAQSRGGSKPVLSPCGIIRPSPLLGLSALTARARHGIGLYTGLSDVGHVSTICRAATGRGPGRGPNSKKKPRYERGSAPDDSTKKQEDKRKKEIDEKWGQLLYNCEFNVQRIASRNDECIADYNWRQDTSSDLQLVSLAFVGLILCNSFLRSLLVYMGPPASMADYWTSMYEVIVLSFGQEFPDPEMGDIARQMFSVGVAGIGLCFLALVLALVEQVVLEMIERNVRQGSRVYETEHVLIAGWCTSQRDLEVVWKCLEQLCHAYRNDGGTVVVVLTQREKLEMESLFRRAIPDDQRFGTKFVFRQGNPLVVQDLDMVAAKHAHSIMVVSDQSRCPEEADAQSLRCAILLDELTFEQASKRQSEAQAQAQEEVPPIPSVSWSYHGMTPKQQAKPADLTASNGNTTNGNGSPTFVRDVRMNDSLAAACTDAAAVAQPGAGGLQPAVCVEAPACDGAAAAGGVQEVDGMCDVDVGMGGVTAGMFRGGMRLCARPQLVLPPSMRAPGAGTLSPFASHGSSLSTLSSTDPSLHILASSTTLGVSVLATVASLADTINIRVQNPALRSPSPVQQELTCPAAAAVLCLESGGAACDIRPSSPGSGRPASPNGRPASPGQNGNGAAVRKAAGTLPDVPPVPALASGTASNGNGGVDGIENGTGTEGMDTPMIGPAVAVATRILNHIVPLQLQPSTASATPVLAMAGAQVQQAQQAAGSAQMQVVEQPGIISGPGSADNSIVASMNTLDRLSALVIDNTMPATTMPTPAASTASTSTASHTLNSAPAADNATSTNADSSGTAGAHGAFKAEGQDETGQQSGSEEDPNEKLKHLMAEAQQWLSKARDLAAEAVSKGPEVVSKVPFFSQFMATSSMDGDEKQKRKRKTQSKAGHVIVELKTSNAVPLLKFSCSSRFMAVPTAHLNARRLAKMIREPIIASLTQQLMDFKNPTNLFVQHIPELVGRRFGELNFWFDDGIVIGVYKSHKDKMHLVPSASYIVGPNDKLVLFRPTYTTSHLYKPRKQPVVPIIAGSWSAAKAKPQPDFEAAANAANSTTFTLQSTQQHTQSQTSANNSAQTTSPVMASTPAGIAAAVSQSRPPSPPDVQEASEEMGDDINMAATMDRRAKAAAQAALSALETPRRSPDPNAMQTTTRNSSSVNTTRVVDRGVNEATVSLDDYVHHASVSESMSGSSADEGDMPLDPWMSQVAQRGAAERGERGGVINVGVHLPRNEEERRVMQENGRKSALMSVTDGEKSPLDSTLDVQRTSVDLPPDSTIMGAHIHDNNNASSSGDVWLHNVRVQPVSPGFRAPDAARSAFSPYTANNNSSNGSRNINRAAGARDASALIDMNNMRSSSTASATLGSYETSAQTSAIFMVPMEWLRVDDNPRSVLVCGWGEQSFMRALLRELDQGQAALPPGSEVVFANLHDNVTSLAKAVQMVRVRNVSVQHVTVDPMQRSELAQVALHKFAAAIVLCDERWVDPDEDAANGVDMLGQADMLRLDAMVMMVQLNLRKVLEDQERPSINIICQKVAMEGMTRFEDRKRLPLGISVNFTSFAAKLLTQASYSPMFLSAYAQYGASGDFKVIDAGQLTDVGEKLSYWQLVARAQALRKVLIGWYMLPERVERPMEMVLNPGKEYRKQKRVWNKGDNMRKFVVLQRKNAPDTLHDVCSMESEDDDQDFGDSVSSALADLDNRQARWVQMCTAEVVQSAASGTQGVTTRDSNGDPMMDGVENDTDTDGSWNDSMEEIPDVDVGAMGVGVGAGEGNGMSVWGRK